MTTSDHRPEVKEGWRLARPKPGYSGRRLRIMKTLLLLLLLCEGSLVFGQAAKFEKPQFDIVDFSKKFEVVQWLVTYDEVAWKTTDLALASDKEEIARMGKEWFCFQDKNGLWHAVYGKLENNKFDQVFHYIVDSAGKITRTKDKIDDGFLVSHARALDLATARLKDSIPTNSPAHNSYIRQNADRSFTVWLLPAFQTDNIAVYGGEFVYTIDPAAEKITKDESYFQGSFRGFKSTPPREIWLTYAEKEKPTLGSIFFVWYYKEYFTHITIDNSKSTSTVMKTGNEYIWVHVEKDKKSAAAPNQR
jgi:hypothetical protein